MFELLTIASSVKHFCLLDSVNASIFIKIDRVLWLQFSQIQVDLNHS